MKEDRLVFGEIKNFKVGQIFKDRAELSNKDLGKLITDATVYLECHMTVANIKKMMATANNRKAFFSEFK